MAGPAGCASAAAAASRPRALMPPASSRASGERAASPSCSRASSDARRVGRRGPARFRGPRVARAAADGALGGTERGVDDEFAAAAASPASPSSSASSSSASASSALLDAIPAIPPSQLEDAFMIGSPAEREHWFPVAFANDLDGTTMIPFDLFNVPWVAFRDADGAAGCVKDECAHRACPISLGKLVDGRVQCPYHGWEYTTGGECVKMPSIKKLLPNVYVDAAPVVERDGLLYVWAGRWSEDGGEGAAGKARAAEMLESGASHATPPGFDVMAEVTVEIAMDADDMLARLMDIGARSEAGDVLAFRRVSTNGGERAELGDDVFPKLVAGALRNFREPVPRRVAFYPGRVLESTIALEGGPGDWNIHQTHVVLPSRPGRTRVLFRMATDFVAAPKLARKIGGRVWAQLAEMVLHEQLENVRVVGGGKENVLAVDEYQEWRQSVDEAE